MRLVQQRNCEAPTHLRVVHARGGAQLVVGRTGASQERLLVKKHGPPVRFVRAKESAAEGAASHLAAAGAVKEDRDARDVESAHGGAAVECVPWPARHPADARHKQRVISQCQTRGRRTTGKEGPTSKAAGAEGAHRQNVALSYSSKFSSSSWQTGFGPVGAAPRRVTPNEALLVALAWLTCRAHRAEGRLSHAVCSFAIKHAETATRGAPKRDEHVRARFTDAGRRRGGGGGATRGACATVRGCGGCAPPCACPVIAARRAGRARWSTASSEVDCSIADRGPRSADSPSRVVSAEVHSCGGRVGRRRSTACHARTSSALAGVNAESMLVGQPITLLIAAAAIRLLTAPYCGEAAGKPPAGMPGSRMRMAPPRLTKVPADAASTSASSG